MRNIDKSHNDIKVKAFCNASSVWGSLVKSYLLVTSINQSHYLL